MARYNLHIEHADGTRILDRRYRIEITTAGTGTITTATDLSYTVTDADTMPGTAGWEDGPVVGFPEAATRRMTLALNRLPSTMAAALVSPTVSGGGTITIGSYSRAFDLVNVVAIYSDRDATSADPDAPPLANTTTLEQLLVQRAIPKQSGVAGPELVTLELDLVDATKWVLETMKAADIEAATFALSAGTVHRYLYSDVWSDGTRTYTVRHGDVDNPFGIFRQYTVHSLGTIFRAVESVGAQILTQITRRVAGSTLSFHDTSGASGDTRRHWTFYPPNGGVNGLHGSTAWAGDRLICTRVALNSSPTVAFHGFLYNVEEESVPEDTLGSWATVWDWIADEARSAACVAVTRYRDVTAVDAIVALRRMAEPDTSSGTAVYAQLSTDRFQSPEVPFEIGAGLVAMSRYVTPNASSNDADPVELKSAWGAAGDESWSVPRGFHTNPIAWPADDRRYLVANPIGVNSYANVDLVTQAFNCLTIFHETTVGGLLAVAAPVRLHSYCAVDIYSTVITSGEYTGGLPAPNPVEDYSEDSEEGDGDLGTPYLVAVAHQQREAGAPRAAAWAMEYTHGNPPMVTYRPKVRTSALLGTLGNIVDPADFPSGNALLGVGAYFGALPGNPRIKAIEDDLLGDQLATVTLVGSA